MEGFRNFYEILIIIFQATQLFLKNLLSDIQKDILISQKELRKSDIDYKSGIPTTTSSLNDNSIQELRVIVPLDVMDACKNNSLFNFLTNEGLDAIEQTQFI